MQPFSWAEGSQLPLLGEEVVLRAQQRPGIVLEGGTLHVGGGNTPQLWRRRVLKWLHTQALHFYAARVATIAPAIGVEVPPLRLSNARTQWGSCSRRHGGNVRIALHWKLYCLPLPLIDYVVAHELAHIRELNHSARFWAEVARVCPDFAERRKRLNQLGRALPQF